MVGGLKKMVPIDHALITRRFPSQNCDLKYGSRAVAGSLGSSTLHKQGESF